jgi:hypothetical protein
MSQTQARFSPYEGTSVANLSPFLPGSPKDDCPPGQGITSGSVRQEDSFSPIRPRQQEAMGSRFLWLSWPHLTTTEGGEANNWV